MSWLATSPSPRTLGEALALRPDLLAGLRGLEAAFVAEPTLDADLRLRCRLRIAQLLGVPGTAATPPDPDDVVVEFVEQFVLDVHGVSDALVSRLGTVPADMAVTVVPTPTPLE